MKRNVLLQCVAFAAMFFFTLPGICQTGVQIGGAVYGGGRRADVAGNSYVMVVNADSIGAVYGGNDIAGEVKGTGGATIRLGSEDAAGAFGSSAWTTAGTTTATLKIGSVYGGGNGYYIYPDPIGDVVHAGENDFTIDAEYELKYHHYTGGGTTSDPVVDLLPTEEVLPAGTYAIPAVKKTVIDVYSPHVFIDSLFGGAKNAFVGEATSEPSLVSADINIHNGTIYALFGGNNYGGIITNLLDIAVSDTYKKPTTSYPYYTSANLGKTHGIKYLFGGGNRVEADKVNILVAGGQIDTAFAGGNSATVTSTTFKVETGADNRIFGTAFAPYGEFTLFDGSTISDRVKTVKTDGGITADYDYPFNTKGGYLQADGSYHAVPEDSTNVYNIRTLFGGNNAKAMACLPQLQLVSGGIGTVYGGGNAGDMTYCGNKAGPIADPTAEAAIDDTIISTMVELTSPELYADYVYGGCQMASVDYGTYVRIEGAKVGHVFGGCNISGDVGSYRKVKRKYYQYDVNGNLTSATFTLEHTANTWVLIQPGARIFHNVFGGANGYYHCADENGERYVSGKQFSDHNYEGKMIPSVNITRVIVSGGHVYGDLYAGGNMAPVGFAQFYPFRDEDIVAPEVIPERESGVSRLNINSDTTKIGGNVQYLPGVYEKDDAGNTLLDVNGDPVPVIDPATISQPVILGNVYGGGNMASIYGLMDMRISGRPVVNGSVYGGNDKSGHVESNYRESIIDDILLTSDGTLRTTDNASVYLRVMGAPKIGAVYGGGNGNYDYTVDPDDHYSIGDQLCDPNDRPNQTSTYVDINVGHGAYIDEVYGGGNNVTENDKVTVLINCGGTVRPIKDLVGTVYGGNNRAAMNIVPDIIMRRGRVHNVYGGGNAGDMLGVAEHEDHAGISTYVPLNSREIYVSGTIYGGSNQSYVAGNTLVALDAGKVENIFGGNNVSGRVRGQTHVHINGGEVTQVYGGSNGYYTYRTVEGQATEVYPFGTAEADQIPANIVGYGDLPSCYDTYVMLHGGIIHNNVYGGGYAGTCENTTVEVKGDAILSGAAPGAAPGAIYGGGRGNSLQLGFCDNVQGSHLGSVTDSARVYLYSCDTSKIGKVYGGGDAGDVGTSYVVLYPTFHHHFTHMYAGCRAANVIGTATMVLNGMVKDGFVLADTVYGGNDVAGYVNKTNLIINSGRYGAAFGGGNGDYNYINYYRNYHQVLRGLTKEQADDAWFAALTTCWDSIPSTQEVVFTINDRSLTKYDSTFFTGYVYGGGNMALVGNRSIGSSRYERDVNGNFTVFHKDDVPVVDSAEYGRIEFNIHGGYFAKRVFAGARGKATYLGDFRPFFGRNNRKGEGQGENEGLQLVYGLKQVNMDGGSIMLSLHGGSEFINDGYPYECIDKTHTTLRPSSIVNIVGGDITKSVYGGGFEGTIYGSVYVNVGKEAVEHSEVWSKQYGKVSGSEGYNRSYVSFEHCKPVTSIDGSDIAIRRASDLVRSDIYLHASIYAGSDWGDAGKKAVFNTPGVYGGETNIHIDGKGYVTYNTDELVDNMMIAEGLFGAGTSTEGGDVNRNIQFFNYGKSSCLTTDRTMQTIQRADRVILDHVYITFSGAQDAYSAFPSQKYSINRVRNLILRDDNQIVIETPAINIDTMQSMMRITSPTNTTQLHHDEAVYDGTYALYTIDKNEVTNSNSFCLDNMNTATHCGVLDIAGVNRNVLLINNGSFLSVLGYRDDNPNDTEYINNNTTYGPVLGYCYLGSGDGWEVNVFARAKTIRSGATNQEDGKTYYNDGFWSLCADDNVDPDTGSSMVDENDDELGYSNSKINSVLQGHRTWRVGAPDDGRSRKVTIVANQKPQNYAPHNQWLKVNDDTDNGQWTEIGGTTTYHHYAYATAALELPPANAGSFYTLANVIVDVENAGEVKLIRAAWDPEATGDNKWKCVSPAVDGREIESNISYNFGLMFKLDGAFDEWNVRPTKSSIGEVVIAGNNYTSFTTADSTHKVAAGSVDVINKLKFALTYNTEFSRTLVRTITFEMIEHRADGTDAPINITVDIATIIDTFGTINARTLAMYNEGIDHKYVRKVVLPATYEQRQLYLTGIQWSYDTECGTVPRYYLTDTNSSKADEYVDVYGVLHETAKANINSFSVTMTPGEDVGSSVTAGWYAVEGEEGGKQTVFDIRQLYDNEFDSPQTGTALSQSKQRNGTDIGMLLLPSAAKPTNTSASTYNEEMVAWIQQGQRVGILDGRATAALYFTSFYNGNLVYTDCDKLGEMTLTFNYVGPKDSDGKHSIGEFKVTLTQWSRKKGDTIYIASMPAYDAVSHTGGVRRSAPNGDGTYSTILLKGYNYVLDSLETALAVAETNSSAYAEIAEKIRVLKTGRGKEPRLYLNSFTEALVPHTEDVSGYVSGDVIAIIDTMVLTGNNNVVIHGSDAHNDEYAMVQVIRYSGTHYQLPGEHGAYRGPLMELRDNSQLGVFNMWLNGSGFTRTKPARTTGDSLYTTFGGNRYYAKSKWEHDTLFVNDPMVVVKDNAIFNTVSNVRISNAISQANRYVAGTDEQQLGAAIALVKTGTGTPQLRLGDKTNIFSNAMLNQSFANSLAAPAPALLVGNSGAAVHVNDGLLQLGAAKSGGNVLAYQNYYMWQAPKMDGTNPFFDNGKGGVAYIAGTDTTTYTWNGSEWMNGSTAWTAPDGGVEYAITDMKTYTRNTDKEGDYTYWAFTDPNKMTPNNVSLVRTPKPASDFASITDPVAKADAMEMADAKSNLILLRSALGENAKVGVSKWFPGGHPSYGRDIRDTIAFAQAPTSPEAARLAYVNGNFFADSMAYGIDTFYHNLVSPQKLYLHRCATFKFNEANDIHYHWDAEAHCPGSNDDLHVSLVCGMLPYTYTWYGYKTKLVEQDLTAVPPITAPTHYEIDTATEVLMRQKTTYATVAHEINITTPGNSELVQAARTDTLRLTNVDMPAGVNVDRYYYEVTVKDLAGCELKNNAMVKLVKWNMSNRGSAYLDETNYLGRVVPMAKTVYIQDDNGSNTNNFTTPPGNLHTVTSGLDSNFYHYRAPEGKRFLYYESSAPATPVYTKMLHVTDTNKYLRFFNTYELTARVSPSGQYGTIYYWDNSKDKDNWTVIAGLADPYNPSDDELYTKVLMCYGGGLRVRTVSRQEGGQDAYDFMYWNFAPGAPPEEALFTMPEETSYTLSAFYAPREYWYQVQNVHPGEASYRVDYRGNVHIQDEKGLAWLISTVNGFNYQQAQTFVFDTIFLEAEIYDMGAYRWTPLGNINHPFRGTVVSTVENGSSIKGIFCNEPQLPYVGLFGVLDSARIGNLAATDTNAPYKIRLADSYLAGNNYAGSLAGRALNGTQVYNMEIAHTAISGENAVGGMFGYAEDSEMQFNKVGVIGNGLPDAPDGDNNTTFTAGTTVLDPTHANENIHYVGTSIYLGGMVGEMGGGNVIRNNAVQKHDAALAQPLYAGGIAGKTSPASNRPSSAPRRGGAKNSGSASLVENNYVGMQTSAQSFRVGGLVGDASDVALRNNYAYGNLKSWGNTGNLVAMTGRNVEIEHCFYNSTIGGSTGIAVSNGSVQANDTSAFKGSGNQVTTSIPIDGLDNVTVLLNKYVREQGNGTLLSWRSDLANVNSGYPVFGAPDTIPVHTYLFDSACDSYNWHGAIYSEAGIYRHRSFDSVLLIDSIVTMHLTLNHSTALVVSDSVALGDDYNGHGFSLTYRELVHLLGDTVLDEVQVLHLTDSLLTAHGCDSVVSLHLTVYKHSDVAADEPGSFHFDVQVYPNPTLGTITVESEDLQQVEIFDNVSRKVMQSSATGNTHQMDLTRLSSGAYYVRVTTDKGVAVKKVIKK